MTYVSPLQRKVELYLDLVNQGVPQAQALQQVGSSLAELSASGLDLSTSADLNATIAAADLQLDNYRREQIQAAQQGLPPPSPPPGYSLSGQTTVSNGFGQQPAAEPAGANLTTGPANLPAPAADNTALLTVGVTPTAVTTTDLLAPGPNISTSAPEPLPTGAGTLSPAELQSGVIARTFEGNANYQAVQANNEQRRQIIREYAADGKSTAEAYQDPRYVALTNQASQLAQETGAESAFLPVSTYQNSPQLQQQYPVITETDQAVAPTAVDTGPASVDAARSIGSTAQNVEFPVDSAVDSVATPIAAAPLVGTDSSGLLLSESGDIVASGRPGDITASPSPVAVAEVQFAAVQSTATPSAAQNSDYYTPTEFEDQFPRRGVSEPDPLPFDPDLDTVPDEIPSSTNTTFNGTFSATYDPETGQYGVWDNQRGVLVTSGLTQQQAEQEAIDFSRDGIVLTPVQNISPAEPVFDGTFSATFDPETQTWGVWDDQRGVLVATGLTQEQAQRDADEFTGGDFRPAPAILNPVQTQTELEQAAGEQQNATLALARQQQSIREQRGQQNQGDWRVKLRLAPGADYLYKSNDPGILWPLIETDGVIFPYTPRIDTSYRAVYDAVDLTHSNYRGYFYRSSYADFVQLNAAFTAQDTFEAEYLLAVITFFKSLTKMFYGQDAQRGSPPPMVYLTGLGEYQFSEHPCVVTQFNYNLPDTVDYIRARISNVNATNLLARRTPKNAPTNPISSAIQRLASLGQGIKPGALNSPPPPPTLGIDNPTYVPTKIDISLQLLPMQSRRQVSQQFSLKNFANGNLIKGGFW